MDEARYRWQEFKKILEEREIAVNSIELNFPVLDMCFWPENYEIMLDGIRNNSIPVHSVDYLFSSIVSDEEHFQRLQKLTDAIKSSNTITKLRLHEHYDVFKKYYTSSRKLKLFSSSKCRIESLDVAVSMDKQPLKMFIRELEQNKSIKQLRVSESFGILEALAANKSITDLTLRHSHYDFAPLFTKSLQSSRRITKLNIYLTDYRVAQLDVKNLFVAIAGMKVLTSLTMSLATDMWPWEGFAKAIISNDQLETLKLKSTWTGSGDTINSILAGQDLMVPAIAGHRTLSHLSLSSFHFARIIDGLKDNATITRLNLPIEPFLHDPALMHILTSIKSVRRLKLADPRGLQQFINLSPLLKADWPLSQLRIKFDWQPRAMSNYQFFKDLETHPTLDLVDFVSSYGDYLPEKCRQICDKNPFLTVTVLGKPLYPNKDNKSRVNHMMILLTLFRVILLSQDQGLFGLLPREVLLSISEHVIARQYNARQVLCVMDIVASDRSHVLQQREQVRAKLRAVWTRVNSLAAETEASDPEP